MSTDDFAKLKNGIHMQIDKMGGKIEENPAAEEEEAISNPLSDDEEVILTEKTEKVKSSKTSKKSDEEKNPFICLSDSESH